MNDPIEKELVENHFRVAIFGSARINEKNPIFGQVYNLARMLGKAGIDVVTGGGPGLMRAANQGHKAGVKNQNVHSLGLNIKLPFEQEPNPHLDIEREFDRFSERLDTFMALSNVVVVTPGGIGTLLELAYAWQLVQVKHIDTLPIILIGRQWKDLMDWAERGPLKHGFMSESDMDTIFISKSCEDSFRIIQEFHEAFLDGRLIKCPEIGFYSSRSK